MSSLKNLFMHLCRAGNRLVSVSLILFSILILLEPFVHGQIRQRTCLERIWSDFQRCRERQRDHFRYGRFSSGFSFSSDAYQPKYRTECCSYWELMECVHKSAKIFCSDDVDLRKLDKFIELVGLNVPLYVCTEEYPKGTFYCKLPSWFVLTLFFSIFCLLVVFVLIFVCIRNAK